MALRTNFELATTLQNEIASPRAPREWPKYMTARVAADYCDTSRWTIRRHLQPCGRRGKTLIYSIEEVERWMRGESLGGGNVRNDRDEASQRRSDVAWHRSHVAA